LVVIGRYVPQLEFLGVLLGSDPVLAPEERLYQRLLAGNLEEAVEMAEDYVDEHSSREFYDQAGIPALRLAENDRQRSTSDTGYRRLVASTATCVVREIADHVKEKATGPVDAGSDATAAPEAPTRVLCIAGRTELDAAASEMLAQVLQERAIRTKVLQPIAISEGALGQLDLASVEVVCLSYLHPQPQVYARYICRRLHRRAPHLKLLVCCWNTPPHSGQSEDMTRQMAANAVVVSVDAAANQVEAWIAQPVSGPGEVPPVLDTEHERLAAVRELDLSKRKQQFDKVAKEVARTFEAPIALVSLIDDDHQHMPGATGLPPDLDASRQTPREVSICGHVVATDGVVVAEDVTKDPRFADNPLVLEKGIRFYAGAPLRTASGLVLGSLCVIDTNPRSFSEDEQRRLQAMADDLMKELEGST
jgi:GAF domain-containing protein